jgi:hypothetical protein
LYGRKTAIKLDRKIEWYNKNKTGFWVLKDSSGRRRGSCELFPLTDGAIAGLRSGDLAESGIEAGHIEPPGQPGTHRVMYLENLMAIDEEGRVLVEGAVKLILAVPRILAAAGTEMAHGRVYTMVARYCWRRWRRRITESESKLKRWGFSEGGRTKQKLPLYYMDVADLLRAERRWAGGVDPRA